jgi:hypothetical protein
VAPVSSPGDQTVSPARCVSNRSTQQEEDQLTELCSAAFVPPLSSASHINKPQPATPSTANRLNRQPQVVLPHRPDVKLEGASVSAKYVIVNERTNATTRVVLHRLGAGGAAPAGPLGEGEVMEFEEQVYSLSGGEGVGGGGV